MPKKSLVLFVLLSVITSALNYLVYPLFGRIFAPSEYVHITVSLSLFTQISTFLSSIVAITIGLSKSEERESTDGKIELLQAFLFKLFLVLATFFLIFSPLIMHSVNTPALFAVPIALMMLFSIPILVISGYLNGRGQLIKVGLVTLLSASCQASIGLAVALTTHDGLLTMLSMTLSQILTIVIIYTAFSKDRLPKIVEPLKLPLSAGRDAQLGGLIVYTALTALGVMAISLTQVADLFIIQHLKHTNIKFYTDIYVLSRIVFFAGMIFVWPFLGEISIDHHHFNRRPFLKVVGYFSLITLGAFIAVYFFGDRLTTLLFGTNYRLAAVKEVAILSILYKFLLLVITSVVLYLVVLRSNVAIWFAFIASGSVFIFSRLLSQQSTTVSALTKLDSLAGVLAIIAFGILFLTPVNSQNSKSTKATRTTLGL